MLARFSTPIPAPAIPLMHIALAPSTGPARLTGDGVITSGHSRLAIERSARPKSLARSEKIAATSPRMNSSSARKTGQRSPPMAIVVTRSFSKLGPPDCPDIFSSGSIAPGAPLLLPRPKPASELHQVLPLTSPPACSCALPSGPTPGRHASQAHRWGRSCWPRHQTPESSGLQGSLAPPAERPGCTDYKPVD